MSCGPYTTTWCHHAPTCQITHPGVTTECPDTEEPPCTDCQQEHRLAVQALKALMPENC